MLFGPNPVLSSHANTANPHYDVTVFPLRRLETSWRIHYLWSSENGDPPSSSRAHSIQAGQAIHFNGTMSYELTKHLWIGSNGYCLKQISEPKTAFSTTDATIGRPLRSKLQSIPREIPFSPGINFGGPARTGGCNAEAIRKLLKMESDLASKKCRPLWHVKNY